MDKDKGIVEKTIEAVEEFASEVKDAAKHVMDPEPIKPGEQLVMLPSMNSGMFGEPVLPPFVIIPRPRKPRSKKAPTKTAKAAAKKTAKKSAKRAAKKKAAKPWKPASKKRAIGKKKSGKKAVKKKKAKKARS
jgi:hypothetical protein